MFKRNTFLFGVIHGAGFPVLSFFILNEVNTLLITYYFGRPPGLSARFLAILSIASNLIPGYDCQPSPKHDDHARHYEQHAAAHRSSSGVFLGRFQRVISA